MIQIKFRNKDNNWHREKGLAVITCIGINTYRLHGVPFKKLNDLQQILITLRKIYDTNNI